MRAKGDRIKELLARREELAVQLRTMLEQLATTMDGDLLIARTRMF